jgi:ribosomal protein S25
MKNLILSCLKFGKENAITQWEIAEKTGINARRVRQMIRELIEQHGVCIGSTPHQPAGYYLCQTKEELDENYNRLIKQAKKIMSRAVVFQKEPSAEIRGQLELKQFSKLRQLKVIDGGKNV